MAKREDERNIHYFERLMCHCLKIEYDEKNPKELKDFLKFIVPKLMERKELPKPSDTIEEELNVFNNGGRARKVYIDKNGVTMIKERTGKVLKKFFVMESLVSYELYQVLNFVPDEHTFLVDHQYKLQFQDGYGYPLLLGSQEEGDSQVVRYFISDCGTSMDKYRKPYNEDIMTLTVIATICSLPVRYTDYHDGNTCIYQPDELFNFIWSLKLDEFIFEFSWTTYGLVQIIDWDGYFNGGVDSRNEEEECCIIIPSSLSFIRKEFPSVYIGKLGMIVLLEKIITVLKIKNGISLKCRTTTCNKKKRITSIIQVYPCMRSPTNQIPSMKLNSLSSKMDHYSRQFIVKSGYEDLKDMGTFTKIASEMVSMSDMGYFNIPSDTGLVLLRKDMKLIAVKDIVVGTIVTRIPYTLQGNIIGQGYPSFQINKDLSIILLKKILPFIGFGGFANVVIYDDEKTNFRYQFNLKQKTLDLIAIRNISCGELIQYYVSIDYFQIISDIQSMT